MFLWRWVFFSKFLANFYLGFTQSCLTAFPSTNSIVQKCLLSPGVEHERWWWVHDSAWAWLQGLRSWLLFGLPASTVNLSQDIPHLKEKFIWRSCGDSQVLKETLKAIKALSFCQGDWRQPQKAWEDTLEGGKLFPLTCSQQTEAKRKGKQKKKAKLEQEVIRGFLGKTGKEVFHCNLK